MRAILFLGNYARDFISTRICAGRSRSDWQGCLRRSGVAEGFPF